MTSQGESYRPGAPAMTCGVLLLRIAGGCAGWGLGRGAALFITASKAGDEGDLLRAWGARA